MDVNDIVTQTDRMVPIAAAVMLLALVFKVLLNLFDGYKKLAEEERIAAATAKADAAQARQDATEAYAAAAAAQDRISELLDVIERLNQDIADSKLAHRTLEFRYQALETRLLDMEQRFKSP